MNKRALRIFLLAGLLVHGMEAQALVRIDGQTIHADGASGEMAFGQIGASEAYDYLDAGKYRLALIDFEKERKRAIGAGDTLAEARMSTWIGYTLYLMRQRYEDAESNLLQAFEAASKLRDYALMGQAKGYLGLLHAASGKAVEAELDFSQALLAARQSNDVALEYAIRLQMARLEPSRNKKIEALRALWPKILEAGISNGARLDLLFVMGDQLSGLREGKSLPAPMATEVRELSYQVVEKQRELSIPAGDPRKRSMAEGYWARLREMDGNDLEAIRSTESAIGHAQIAAASDLLMKWQAQLGRILSRRKNFKASAQAYRQAASYLEQIRNDIPITYQDGKSSYHETLDPIYRGFADTLLKSLESEQDRENAQAVLREALISLENLKQSELEDYFNDRCSLDPASFANASEGQGSSAAPIPNSASELSRQDMLLYKLRAIPDKTVVLYPIVLTDRLELLLIDAGVIHRKTVPVGAAEVAKQFRQLSSLVRTKQDYSAVSRRLYQWLIAPFESDLRDRGVERIVYIPDDVMRLAPLSVLNDGHSFLMQNYSVITNSALKFVSPPSIRNREPKVLLAGLSKPSEEVVNQIPDAVLASAYPKTSRSLSPESETEEDRNKIIKEVRELRGKPDFLAAAAENLTLPEVENEIKFIQANLPNKTFLNDDFTKSNLAKGLQSGDFSIVHISTHSFFGHSSNESFIMAHDKTISMEDLEKMIRDNPHKDRPIELLTFSSCETAEGDEQSPLGFSGLAIKAKARNALGALWKINDKATERFMELFYSALKSKETKDQALRTAQIGLMRDKAFHRPKFWAPFILVGSW